MQACPCCLLQTEVNRIPPDVFLKGHFLDDSAVKRNLVCWWCWCLETHFAESFLKLFPEAAMKRTWTQQRWGQWNMLGWGWEQQRAAASPLSFCPRDTCWCPWQSGGVWGHESRVGTLDGAEMLYCFSYITQTSFECLWNNLSGC